MLNVLGGWGTRWQVPEQYASSPRKGSFRANLWQIRNCAAFWSSLRWCGMAVMLRRAAAPGPLAVWCAVMSSLLHVRSDMLKDMRLAWNAGLMALNGCLWAAFCNMWI